MRIGFVLAALMAALASSSAFAEGVPSKSKLAKMGLSSMQVVSDQQGEQVRGRGFGAAFFNFSATLTDPTNANANASGQFVGGFTYGQFPRATAGATVQGAGGIDPIAPGAPFTLNLATPTFIGAVSSFGIAFGTGN